MIYAIGFITAKVFTNNNKNPTNHNIKYSLTVTKKSLNNFFTDLNKATNGFGVQHIISGTHNINRYIIMDVIDINSKLHFPKNIICSIESLSIKAGIP